METKTTRKQELLYLDKIDFKPKAIKIKKDAIW